MVTSANDRRAPSGDLPEASHAAARTAEPERRGSSVLGVPLRDVLQVPSLRGTTVLGGHAGLGRLVERMNVIEVPDILPWVKPHELLLTTGYPLIGATAGSDRSSGPDRPADLAGLVREFDRRGLTALAVKPGRYLGDVPGDAIRAADSLGFPLLQLPEGVAFDEVLAEVFAALLDQHSRELARADQLHRALADIVLEGGDLPQIAEEVGRLLEAAVVLCTPDGRVLAEGGSAELRAAFGAQPLFDHTGRLRVEQLRRGLQAAPSGSGQLAVVPVAAGGVDHGRIGAYHPRGGGLSGHGVQALERAATVAALVITKQLAVSAVEGKFRADYLRDALTGNAGDAHSVVEHCSSLGWDVDRPMAVLVAELDADTAADTPRVPVTALALRSAQDRFTAAWLQVVRARDRRAPVVGFSHEVVVLLPLDTAPGRTDADALRAAAGGLVEDCVAAVAGDRGGGRRSFCAGVSRPITGVEQLPEAYDQARKAVAVGRRVRGRGSVSHFDSLGVHRLLSLVPDASELRGFAAEVLRELARDTAEAADLRLTLQTLLDTNLNVAETARLLHFHYNTLRYRIGKLERIVGRFSTDPHLRLDVALALQVVQMRGI